MSFSMPRTGTITDLTAYFSNTAPLTSAGILTIRFQLYRSTTPDNTFTPIPGALVDLLFTGSSVPPVPLFGIVNGLNIPVSPQERLLLVVSLQATGTPVGPIIVTGYASAGLALA